MTPSAPALAYRRAATQRASMVGLVIALYDTLTGDLYRAVAAMASSNIEERTRQLKHGFAVLTQLETLLDLERGGSAAANLQTFYRHLRSEMLRAQFKQDTAILEHLATLVLDVREAWQQLDQRESQTGQSEDVAPSMTEQTSSSVDLRA